MAERSTRIVVKPRHDPASDDVLDDGDVAHVATNSAEIQNRNSPTAASLTLSKERAKPGSFIRHTSGRDTIRVPVAADGTHFSLDLARRGYYTVGAKGAEEKYDSFDAALDALNRMSTPRWRRPNAAGNWGIVSGCSWMDIKKQ